jgi:hypothetical protein
LKEIKDIQIRREVELSLFADDIILNGEKPKDTSKTITTDKMNTLQ